MYRQVDSLAPKRLFTQILLLQLVYYTIGLVFIAFYYIAAGRPFDFYVVFSWEPLRSDTTIGWTLSMVWLLDTFFSVLAMTVIVGRSKLALDFTLTLHGINIIVAWLVTGRFPASILWWAVQGLSMLLMVFLGTWTTKWRELRTSFFDSGSYEMIRPPPTTQRSPLPEQAEMKTKPKTVDS
jgi:hypothetical protein